MGIFSNLLDSVVQKKDKQLTFVEWVNQNATFIQSHLINEGESFLNEQAENLRSLVGCLYLDDHWHYLDKAKKQRYRANLIINTDGVPFLSLIYHSFRHGGVSEKFNSREALKALWVQSRKNTIPQKSLIKPKPEKINNQVPVSKPFDWIPIEINHWQGLLSFGGSHYLKRKKLNSIIIPGLRFAKDHVVVKITNTQNRFCGLQRIYNNGDKRFTKGLEKKGNFALLGLDVLPDKIETVNVCEGVATAITISMAINEPVFSALDAGNIYPVLKNLKQLYPKTRFIIWADNDWQKSEKLLSNGNKLGNTGLIHANRAAFKLRNVLVCTPDFSSFPEDKIKKATDFNDLYQLAGLKTIQETLAKKPDIELALFKDVQRSRKYYHGVLSPGQFESGKKILYKSRYLPKDIFKEEGVHLVRSPIGSGKTEIVEHLVKKNPLSSVLFTTHLISLVENGASRLKLESYNDCDNFDLQIESRLAICLNSLGKLVAEGNLRPYDIVIIDEIEQVLARLTSHIEQKPLVFAILQKLMANAKTLICLDAHLSKTTVEMIQRFCPDKKVTIHFNEYEALDKKAIKLHESIESVQMAALQAIDAKQKVYLTFNSKKEAYKTFSSIKLAFPQKKGLYISGDNTGDSDTKDFFADVNKVSKLYDYIVCTPSVSTGVSIDNGHFDFVGGIFNAQVNTANDCMQALNRVRNQKLLHVFCEKRFSYKTLDPAVIASKWLTTHGFDMELMNLDEQGGKILLNKNYEALLLSVTLNRNRSANNFYESFALLALLEGIKLDYFDNQLDEEIRKNFRNLKKASIAINDDEQIQAIEALTLTPKELISLANKPRKSLDETRLSKKEALIEFYNLDRTNKESIISMESLDNDGRFKKQLLDLELALSNIDNARDVFLKQFKDDYKFRADLNHFATFQILYKKLLKTLHLMEGEEARQLKPDAFFYTDESIIESGFIDWIIEQRKVLQGIIHIPDDKHLKKDPLRFISMLLSRLGLKQRRVGRSSDGIYQLDRARINLLNGLLARRKSGLAGVSMPLDTSSCPVRETKEPSFFAECLNKIKSFFTLPNCQPVFT